MKLGEAIAEIRRREGVQIPCGCPVNHLIECAAARDIRPVMVREGRCGLHLAAAISRVTSGQRIGAFCMQHGPGAEAAGILRRAFSRLRHGRGGPVLVEVPSDRWNAAVAGPLDCTPVAATRHGPGPAEVARRPALPEFITAREAAVARA